MQTGDYDESKIAQNIAWMDWVLQIQTKLTSEQVQGFLILVYGALFPIRSRALIYLVTFTLRSPYRLYACADNANLTR